ncbi:hypothetical protein PHMEG_00017480 [Phytophthora megakarya]|uniref:DDE Tnp4 domain-containing protein n=1 Tax=Phytophthora megakarya TaxID=4795 RepID=A0A225VWG5_9STRA|nr:hypothetical protein PHMEG_00017480 [Phytophthora megakarya]
MGRYVVLALENNKSAIEDKIEQRTQDDSAFLVTVSLPVKEFNLLLAVFSRHYVVKSCPGKRGRPDRFVNKNNVLACILQFYTAAMEAKTLCELFGVPPTTLSRVLKHAEGALAKSLRDIPALLAVMSRLFVVGFALLMKKTTRCMLQQQATGRTLFNGKAYLSFIWLWLRELTSFFREGWLHTVNVAGVLCYGFDGTLIWGRHNIPGSWNDGEMSRCLQSRLADHSAFPVSNALTGKTITPLTYGDLEKASPACRLGLTAMSNSITASSGMGCASKVYRQLLVLLLFNPERRDKA